VIGQVRPRGTHVAFPVELPRAGRVHASFDNDGRVRVRPLRPYAELVVLSDNTRVQGAALGCLNYGAVIWDSWVDLGDEPTLTPTERGMIAARIESALKVVAPEWWKNRTAW